ncbi:MAG TPA: DJ-1/PfpI family protein [Sphingobium sp.]
MTDIAHQPEPLTIGIVLYPGFTLLDMAGPQSALGLHGRTYLFSPTLDPVMSDSGIALVPTTTFSEFQDTLDILLVPGGFGTNEAMRDKELVAFLSRVAGAARYIGSVCSGSLLLGMAGLLEGRRASTHWAALDVLKALGAVAVQERVVCDANVWTGGGVTAGIDFGLRLLAELRGEQVAKLTQLMMEYDPEPPFATGNPRDAGPELVAAARAVLGEDKVQEAISIAATRTKPRS